MKKKYIKILSSFLILVSFVFSIQLEKASAYYACSPGENCKGARMYYGQQVYAKSLNLYLYAGQRVKYDWDNDPAGLMQVDFGVYKDGYLVSKRLVAARYGDNYGFYDVPSSGYYYLFARCEGGNDNRCEGGGTISTDY